MGCISQGCMPELRLKAQTEKMMHKVSSPSGLFDARDPPHLYIAFVRMHAPTKMLCYSFVRAAVDPQPEAFKE